MNCGMHAVLLFPSAPRFRVHLRVKESNFVCVCVCVYAARVPRAHKVIALTHQTGSHQVRSNTRPLEVLCQVRIIERVVASIINANGKKREKMR